mmetsp:Transcript_11307/g.26194  ORF Transcript_11307/g.26194 Transcript_11307/m.26194 type:complete len:177 (+) Transcript_11307:756-1286(+)|eukprot:CAMPEP_0116848966 /NCGR_PEP_ID=MMETSP0418-20121206/15309_1 /TAXON_ID=1158023 /ORGANISM="Astrosyne radiata, Strain 13vi08-1A" /LENGTH=176 /DNA_ID=CAMNT_0004480633 /DNA_START=751 /DNA_END=1281 /DNA_ORIENTATION=-
MWADSAQFQKHSIGSFLAHQMMRHAECEATYVFSVACESVGMLLLIRMLTWNTEMALSDDSSFVDGWDCLQFSRVVKVAFEETTSSAVSFREDSTRIPVSDMRWDVCCADPERRAAAEQIFSSEKRPIHFILPGDEWVELRQALVAGQKHMLAEAFQGAVMGLNATKSRLSVLPLV